MTNFPQYAAAQAARQKALIALLRAPSPPKPPDPCHWAVQRLGVDLARSLADPGQEIEP